jgi:cobalt-zinc-cadmium efflux system outer membrane protein
MRPFLFVVTVVLPLELALASVSPIRAEAISAPAGPVLTLNEAIALARGDQPTVAAFEREAVASEEAAEAARTLPDPQVTAGIRDFPVTGDNALSPTADDFTMYTIGVMREQVRRSRREAEATRLRAAAVVSRAEGTAREREIRRDVMIAWIEAVEGAARQRLLARVIHDLEAGRQIIEAGVPTGASTPALALQAQAEIALAEAQLAEARGAESRARAELARWIGAAAHRPLPDAIPSLAIPPMALDHYVSADHPHVRVAEAQEQAARRQIDAARADRRPNLTWEVMYGWRPEFGDLVSARVTIPIQINRGRLQNRRIAEAEARADAALLRAEGVRRELGSAYLAALADYRNAEAQLAVLRDRAIPSLEASFEAAEARYAGGQGSLELPLDIVRRYVEAHILSVELQGRRSRAAAEIIYLMGEAGR